MNGDTVTFTTEEIAAMVVLVAKFDASTAKDDGIRALIYKCKMVDSSRPKYLRVED